MLPLPQVIAMPLSISFVKVHVKYSLHYYYYYYYYFTREREKRKKPKRDKQRKEKKNLPDVLYLILRPIRIEDGVPGCAAFARRLSVMVRL
jgi:hypothetical protein